MKRAILTAVAACLIATPLAFAQAQNPAPNQNPNTNQRHEHRMGNQENVQARVEHRVARLTRALSLTASQQQQATTIFTNAANANTPVLAELKSATRSLATAVKSTDASSSIKQYSATIGNDAGQLAANEASAYQQFYQMLTPDQQNRMAQMRGRMFGMRGFGGHGVM